MGRSTSGKSILVVEDNFLTARLLEATLESCGYSVVVARSGDEVLDVAREHQPSLILLNMNLSRPSGSEVLRSLGPRRGGVPVISMTVLGQAEVQASASRLGVRHFLELPFDPKVLVHQVQSILENGTVP